MSGSATAVRPDGGITFTRLLTSTPAEVFGAFADARKLARWWGPPECPVVACTLDFRPGGVWHYGLRSSASGQAFWSRAVFEEIVTDARIVFVETSSDAEGGVTPDRSPAHTTVTLAQVPDGTALRIDVRHVSAQEARRASQRGVKVGFNRALDQLVDLLQTESKERRP